MGIFNGFCIVLKVAIVCIVFGNTVAVLEVSPSEAVSQIEEVAVNGKHLNNLTRCSSTELTLSKESLLYTWEIKGFLAYFTFMKKFGQLFEVKTEEVSFKSDIVDGKWFFKLSKVISPPGQESVVISSTYSYEAKQPKKLNFNIQLSILQNEKEIVLPILKSSNPVVMQQRLYNRRGYSSYLEYVHTFTWTDVDQAVENIIKQSKPAQEKETGDEADVMEDEEDSTGTGGGDDILLRFLITSYFPSDPVYTRSENCQSGGSSETLPGLIRDSDAKTIKKQMNPPYLKHSNSMLHDDRFADVLLKSENSVFQAHRIILATSSPVFSAMLNNDTTASLENDIVEISNGTKNSEIPVTIQIDSGLPAEAITEMLRYIYTGRVTSLDRLADKLIKAAHLYGLPGLKQTCEKILYQKIRPENAIEMYNLGHEVASSKIIRRAFVILKANKSKIAGESEDFRRLTSKHPGLMFELFVS